MARSLRIKIPGAFYHVTSRGNERKALFTYFRVVIRRFWFTLKNMPKNSHNTTTKSIHPNRRQHVYSGQ
ncbi:hypothetical protein D1AOALGA4SA_12361 [Olavius algarvensis Delta 1 endosymbiont]|nr:hypothetical protein D1AOALGA4SA_12361 [Olavius algarvensis Delta 1 endosymbiont]